MATLSEASQAPYVPHSCAHCRKFVISTPGHRQLGYSEFTYRLPYSVPEARVAAKDVCSLYRAFIGLIIRPAKRSKFFCGILNNLNVDIEGVYGRANVVELAEILTKHPFRIAIQRNISNPAIIAKLAVYEDYRGAISMEVMAGRYSRGGAFRCSECHGEELISGIPLLCFSLIMMMPAVVPALVLAVAPFTVSIAMPHGGRSRSCCARHCTLP
jgi:hypothetical protein